MLDKTLLKGLAVIESLGKSDHARGVSEISRELNLSKTATHRLLQTLVSARYVMRDEKTEGYRLTTKTWEIGSRVLARLDIKQLGATYLQRLAKQCNESVHITVLDGNEVIYIDKIDSPHPLRTYSLVGGRAPAHCVATGKALLAHQGDELIAQVGTSLKGYTKRTITTMAALQKELKQVRTRGYAVNRGEWRDDIYSVGAPVFNAQGRCVAAMGISAPANRMQGSVEKLGRLVSRLAMEFSGSLGHAA
ncbi:MAG: IclR family transcriptional regulator [Burkholderiales bacterium]